MTPFMVSYYRRLITSAPNAPMADRYRDQLKTAGFSAREATQAPQQTRLAKRPIPAAAGSTRKGTQAKPKRNAAAKRITASLADFAHLAAPAADAPATATEILRAAAIARGEIKLPSNRPEPGSLAAKILAAGEKRRRL